MPFEVPKGDDTRARIPTVLEVVYLCSPAVRGDLLLKLGRSAEAKAEFEKAARLATNARERDLLLARAASCAGPGTGQEHT